MNSPQCVDMAFNLCNRVEFDVGPTNESDLAITLICNSIICIMWAMALVGSPGEIHPGVLPLCMQLL